MADYPSAIFTPRVVENVPGQTFDPTKTTRIYAEDENLPNDEIVAIESTLGVNVQGDYDTLVERLDATPPTPQYLMALEGFSVDTVANIVIGTVPSGRQYLFTGMLIKQNGEIGSYATVSFGIKNNTTDFYAFPDQTYFDTGDAHRYRYVSFQDWYYQNDSGHEIAVDVTVAGSGDNTASIYLLGIDISA